MYSHSYSFFVSLIFFGQGCSVLRLVRGCIEFEVDAVHFPNYHLAEECHVVVHLFSKIADEWFRSSLYFAIFPFHSTMSSFILAWLLITWVHLREGGVLVADGWPVNLLGLHLLLMVAVGGRFRRCSGILKVLRSVGQPGIGMGPCCPSLPVGIP